MTDYDIKLVVIDEAQDFGVVVYYCLRHLFRKSYFTIVGDIMQNISEGGLDEWSTLVNNIFDNNAEYAKLLKSYRNTIEITTFAEKLMKYLGKHNFNIQPLIRHGQKVQLYSFRNQKEKIHKIKEILSDSGLNGQMCAIICKENSVAEYIVPLLNEVLKVTLLNTKEETLQHGIYAMSLHNAKGLEFDTVFVWDFDDYISEKSLISHNSLYVAITRALHNLHIFTNNESVRELII